MSGPEHRRRVFPLRMAWREARGARRHLAYLAASIGLGVAAVVAVDSFADSLERTVARSAKALLGGDVEIRSNQPLSPEAAAVVANPGPDVVAVTRVRELVAMTQGPDGRSQIVELKAVDPGYPLYGRVVSNPNQPLSSLIGSGRVLVHGSLLAKLGLAAGAHLRIGDADFAISGILVEEPDRTVGLFSLGPRVLMAAADLDRTGLVKTGSRVRYRTLFMLAEGRPAEPFRDGLAARLPDPGLRALTYIQGQPGLRRFWTQLTTYLGLTGLVALMVGGIGVAVSVSAFLRARRPTIAVLKCLGAGSRELYALYLTQTGILGLVGSLAGAALGSALQPFLAPVIARVLPFPIDPGFSPRAVLTGLAMGLGVTLLFALSPLQEIRRITPALILRSEVERASPGRRPWIAALISAAGLAGLALWQAGSLKTGGLFAGGLGAALGVLAVCARLVTAAARRNRRGSLIWRQAVANLHRPGSQAVAVLIAGGLAAMLILCVALLERRLVEELSSAHAGEAPAFFFIDIQPDQAGPFRNLLARSSGGAPPELIPAVRSRLAAIDGRRIAPESKAGREGTWYLSREYVLTWAAEPPSHNAVVAGRWWSPDEAAREPLISVEDDLAKQLSVDIGGTLSFDIQGVSITGRVANLRRVDWETFNANFFVIFSPGALAGAPMTYIATAQVPPSEETRVQSDVVAAFPNVTAIPVREVLERAASVLDQIAFALRLVAGASVLSGIVVMAAALGVTRAERLYQSVILKALGATRGFVARVFAVEYLLLGAAAGVSGTALAAILAWAILRFGLELSWRWTPGTLVVGALGAMVLALAVGFLGTYRLLGRSPLSVLRSE